eukprot:26238_1
MSLVHVWSSIIFSFNYYSQGTLRIFALYSHTTNGSTVIMRVVLMPPNEMTNHCLDIYIYIHTYLHIYGMVNHVQQLHLLHSSCKFSGTRFWDSNDERLGGVSCEKAST